MDLYSCSKWNEALDEGRVSLTGSDYNAYVSNKQTDMIRTGITITQARACPNYGYVEFYLDPKELKQRFS